MPVIAIRQIDLAFGGPKLLDGAQLTIEPRERVCLIGRNGEGKSSLLKVLSGEIQPDAIEMESARNVRIAMMRQDIPVYDDETSVFAVAVEGRDDLSAKLNAYHNVSRQLGEPEADTDAILARMADLQHELEASGGWELEQQVEATLSQLDLDPDAHYARLSGGMKRRVMLAQALVARPELLLLDEPTNHLDIASIAWLEDFLKKLDCAILFITHDRAFLRSVATRILELDRGTLTRFDCGYDTYLERKEALLQAEAKQQAVFDKKLAQEETWIRQGIKARRTRNEGRVRALQQMRQERSQRREVRDGPTFSLHGGELSGRKVIATKQLGFSWEAQTIVSGLTTTLMRGDKVGIIGPNGCGKTTLIQLLLGKLTPDTGTVKLGTHLNVAYFDQNRETLKLDATVAWNVAGDSDHVHVNGSKRHVYGYLQDFLFPPDRARSQVKMLSGGERNRLLLARLFTREANLLIMDEPTNDLDLETLELLENLLVEYSGTLLLVSHDREFLNRVVTSTLAIEPAGKIVETVGGYDDYLGRQAMKALPKSPVKAATKAERPKDRPQTISQKEERELNALPAQIEALESRQANLVASMGQPDFGKPGGIDAAAVTQELKALEAMLQTHYERWETLEALPKRRQ